MKRDIKGKVVILMDTDEQLHEFDTSDGIPNLICKRLVNDKKTNSTRLVNIKSNPKSPKTEIEDVLNGKIFYETLKAFKLDNSDLLDFVIDSDTKDERPSYFALDLTVGNITKLDEFFNKTPQNKFLFARKYISLCKNTDVVPNWIDDIKTFIR